MSSDRTEGSIWRSPTVRCSFQTGLPDRIERTDILGGLIHEYHAVAA